MWKISGPQHQGPLHVLQTVTCRKQYHFVPIASTFKSIFSCCRPYYLCFAFLWPFFFLRQGLPNKPCFPRLSVLHGAGHPSSHLPASEAQCGTRPPICSADAALLPRPLLACGLFCITMLFAIGGHGKFTWNRDSYFNATICRQLRIIFATFNKSFHNLFPFLHAYWRLKVVNFNPYILIKWLNYCCWMVGHYLQLVYGS